MVDISLITNVTPLTLNMSLVNDSSELLPNMVENANSITDGYFGLGIMIVLFIGLLYLLYKDTGDIRLDASRSMLVSSGIVSLIGVIALYSGLFTSFQHVGWFFLIFLINLIFIYYQKKKGY